MNERRIDITRDECTEIEALFNKYQSYCNVLGFLSNYGSLDEDNTFFDKKWAEAIELNMELEKLKSKIDTKYRPTDEIYTQYYFDFNNSQLVYSK